MAFSLNYSAEVFTGSVVSYGALITEGVIDWQAPSAEDLVIKLGDAVGANKLSITDSGGVEVMSVNSDGVMGGALVAAASTLSAPAGGVLNFQRNDTTVGTNDYIGTINFQTNDSSLVVSPNYQTVAAISVNADEDFDDADDAGSKMCFWTNPIGTEACQIEMALEGDVLKVDHFREITTDHGMDFILSTVRFILPADDQVYINADTTTNTRTDGALKVELMTATDGAEAVMVTARTTAATGNNDLRGINVSAWSDTVITAGSPNIYGVYSNAAKVTADSTVGTVSMFGVYGLANNTGSTDAGVKNTYGGYFSGTGDAAGTSTAYGVYATATGADTNWAGYFNGNVFVNGTVNASSGFTDGTMTIDGTGGMSGVGSIAMAGTIVGVTTAITGTKASALTISVPTRGTDDANGVGLTIVADAGGSGGAGVHNGGIVQIYGGAKAGAGTDGYVKIGHTAGAPTNIASFDDDSAYVKGQFEVGGIVYFQDTVQMSGSGGLQFYNGAVHYGLLSGQADDGLHLALNLIENQGNANLILTAWGNYNKDHDHDVASTNPTLFVHSATDPDTDNTEYATHRWNETSIGGDSGSFSGWKSITELVTVPVDSGLAPAVESTANLFPANSLILGVCFRVVDAPGGGAALIDIGASGGDLDLWIDGASCDVLGETGSSPKDSQVILTGPLYQRLAAKATLTTDADVTINDMIVRVTVYYMDFTPPALNT